MKDFDKQLAELQKNMEPLQEMNSVALLAFERIARKNYELMGDLVDYAVAQVQIPQGKSNAQEVFEQQSAEAKAFAEKVNVRAAEYMELAGELGGMITSAAEPNVETSAEAEVTAEANVEPVAKKTAARKKVAKKAAAKKVAS